MQQNIECLKHSHKFDHICFLCQGVYLCQECKINHNSYHNEHSVILIEEFIDQLNQTNINLASQLTYAKFIQDFMQSNLSQFGLDIDSCNNVFQNKMIHPKFIQCMCIKLHNKARELLFQLNTIQHEIKIFQDQINQSTFLIQHSNMKKFNNSQQIIWSLKLKKIDHSFRNQILQIIDQINIFISLEIHDENYISQLYLQQKQDQFIKKVQLQFPNICLSICYITYFKFNHQRNQLFASVQQQVNQTNFQVLDIYKIIIYQSENFTEDSISHEQIYNEIGIQFDKFKKIKSIKYFDKIKKLITLHINGELNIWDPFIIDKEKQLILQLQNTNIYNPNCITTLKPDNLLLANKNGQIQIFYVENTQIKLSNQMHTLDEIECVCYLEQKDLLAVSVRRPLIYIKILNYENKIFVKQLNVGQDAITQMIDFSFQDLLVCTNICQNATKENYSFFYLHLKTGKVVNSIQKSLCKDMVQIEYWPQRQQILTISCKEMQLWDQTNFMMQFEIITENSVQNISVLEDQILTSEGLSNCLEIWSFNF